ncbi:uncharacterized protein LOC101782157 [Setaria italica]|uniref:uncharacterized protein LOC101782157 n=1 Tax=Setaria italica TaxID=4555 RepID=UPI0006482807|nr:uncharacterized protein LOC101782157 [Setaria italica]
MDYPDHIGVLGRLPLLVAPIITNSCLSKVLMDGGSILNIMYIAILDEMKIPRSELQPTGAPFHRVILGKQAVPLGRIDMPVTFSTRANLCTEILTFEVVNFEGSYHAIFGRPCYVKFMVTPNYTYLKLKIPKPHGVITISANHEFTLLCDVKNCKLATHTIRSLEFFEIQQITQEVASDSNKASTLGAFKPTEDAKVIQFDPEDSNKVVWISTALSTK